VFLEEKQSKMRSKRFVDLSFISPYDPHAVDVAKKLISMAIQAACDLYPKNIAEQISSLDDLRPLTFPHCG
jgi:hypothetical protein